MTLHSLPVFVRLAGRPVILIGEGDAAEAKRRLLERAGAMVVGEDGVATHPFVPSEVEAPASNGPSTSLGTNGKEEARLAIVVDDEAAVGRLKARGILVNAVDRPELCDFTLPAIVDRDPVIVAIGTGGASAGLAAALRQRIEQWLSPKLGKLAQLLHWAKDDLREAFPDPSERRQMIAKALASGGVLDLAEPNLDNPFWIGDLDRPEDWTIRYINIRYSDPDMLTLGDARALAMADRVIHRAEIPAAILDRARADAPRILAPRAPIGAPPPGPGLTVDIGVA